MQIVPIRSTEDIPPGIAGFPASIPAAAIAPPQITVGPTAANTAILPRLSVMIPVCNGENFLRATIESVLAQSYPAFEILVINDGSVDQTAAIAASFGSRIRLTNRPNAGVSATRNYGIACAANEWVVLMDHDDLWETNHLENIAKAILSQPRADLCYTGRRHLSPNPVGGGFSAGDQVQVPDAEHLPKALLDHCPFIPSSVAVRRSRVLALGGFDSRHLNAQDWDLWLRLLHDGATFVHSPEPTLLYRVHPGSRTNKPLRALAHSKNVVRTSVLPYLSGLRRLTHGSRVISRLEGEAAILLRENGMPGALPLMLRSIFRNPFHEIRRYRIASHILLRGYRKTSPSI
jgi:glycosyltransferase involved in cell wall biosynthesis